MPKIVVTIPYYESDKEKRGVLSRCLASLDGHDEVIVVAGKQPTLPHAWNICLDLGFGMGADYVILANDDIELTKGDLSMLCEPDKVVNPLVNGGVFKVFHAHIFGIPKSVYEKVGKFDEQFTIYWSDTDYAVRLMDMGIDVVTNFEVDVSHPEPARTLKSYANTLEAEDKGKFIAKWGRTYIDPIRER